MGQNNPHTEYYPKMPCLPSKQFASPVSLALICEEFIFLLVFPYWKKSCCRRNQNFPQNIIPSGITSEWPPLGPEFKVIPVVLGTNGTLGKGAQKFFSLLCREMVSYGRIPAWYFWSNILPDFMSNLDRGAHDLHLCWNRKRLNSQNPASIRLFDRTTRLGLEGSNRISYSGSRPQNRL